jgi:hypothetical protein
MANLMQDGGQFIESKEPANNGYGQNGFQKASSDLPGNKKTTSGFLPEVTLPATDDNWQTRKVKADAYATHPGMAPRKSASTIPSNGRPVTRKI